MDEMLQTADDPVVCFLDIDCLPYDAATLRHVHDWVAEEEAFAGNAQNVSHTEMRQRVYAAASMLMVSVEAWRRLGRPSLAWAMRRRVPPTRLAELRRPTQQIDTAQALSLAADAAGHPYRLLYPRGYDEGPTWQLGPYGTYGRGTWYPGTWHYFRASALRGEAPELWRERVRQILADEAPGPAHPSPTWLEGRRGPVDATTEL